MRLSEIEKKALNIALEGVVGEVFIFGSRIDDNKKGGDLDILIFSKENAFKLSQEVTVRFFKVCEEKIDVIVMNPENLSKEQVAFLNIIEKIKLFNNKVE
ncbi:MAG: nucleotidyltransferase domain-containing protein [Bacteroidetes bacterium]|nr:MAG: nucleotidyltransferase domain-containing protein [Bacteroidota bacterium]